MSIYRLMKRLSLVCTLILASLFVPDTTPVQAAGIVTNCNDDVQFSTLLASGGMITFNCGTKLINLSSTKSISTNTTIDGGNKITLSGQDAHRLFTVSNGAVLILRNIVLTNGYSSGNGGAIFNGASAGESAGSVSLENSTIRNSRADASGGAIVSVGPLTITNSLLDNNQALNGGALYPRYSTARVSIFDSVLSNNRATDTTNGWGGAILLWDGARVSIFASDIYSNSARIGGGIYNFPGSFVQLSSGTQLRGNTATVKGGGLANYADVFLTSALVSRNRAEGLGQGGGLYNEGAAALISIQHLTLSNNTAYQGAGAANESGSLSMLYATISRNSAGISGGGLYNNGMLFLNKVTLSDNSTAVGGGLYNRTGATLINVTFSGNSGSSAGGGLINFGPTTLTNVTFSGNSSSSGGAINHLGYASSDTLTLTNTIVANSPSGGNCYKQPASVANIVSAGNNISSDNTCALNGTNDKNLVDPQLTALGNYGGSTQVHMPKLGSAAIDGVLGSSAPGTDQRDITRPQGGGYDIGAVERQASDSSLAPRLYVPLVIR